MTRTQWLRHYLQRILRQRPRKSQRLEFVTLNGHRFKRVILGDAYQASEIERCLEQYGPSSHFPPLVARYENEIWAEYVGGPLVRPGDPGLVEAVADFYATLYSRSPRRMATADLGLERSVLQDLRFLVQLGVLDPSSRDALESAARRLDPGEVWVGYDYLDPVLKNFVWRGDGGGLCAVDVESLRDNQLLGIGVAKSIIKWGNGEQKVFFDRLEPVLPGLAAYFPFVELCFITRATKRAMLEGKMKAVRPQRFASFLRRQG
ncbi:MAG: hypothetical protein ABR538_11515 [Candidatus Binatia bacterium]